MHVLRDGDEELASLFGETTSWEDTSKLERCTRMPGPNGVPIVEGLDHFTGRIIQRFYDMGDHVGHLIDVSDGASRALSSAARIDEPQLGFQQFRTFDAGNPA